MDVTLIRKPGPFGLTWVGWLNFLLLQWLGIRLARLREDGRTAGFGLLAPVLPLSGWWSEFIPCEPRLFPFLSLDPPGP